VTAGAILDRRPEGQKRYRLWRDAGKTDFRSFAESVLDWDFSTRWYSEGGEMPSLSLPDYGETIRPDFAVREPDRDDEWQLVVSEWGAQQDLDKPAPGSLGESPGARMERLLRHTEIPAGVIWGGGRLRLVSAPRGESSGHLDFVLDQMEDTAGRPLLNALQLLLRKNRLLSLPTAKRLPALLTESRKYQNEVSERLAGQVVEGLYALLRGISPEVSRRRDEFLADPAKRRTIYRALLTVMMRLVFLLYTEQRGLLPSDRTFVQHYSLMALFERLRADRTHHEDTMAQRFGAWAHLLALFRMIHDGAQSGTMHLPAWKGDLFDPARYPMLEGRDGSGDWRERRITPPRVPDGTVLTVLEKLLVLEGERISYRALDVEQIGSVYEAMMGFHLEIASGKSLAIRAPGAASLLNLEELLKAKPGSRGKFVKERTGRDLTQRVLDPVRKAETVEALHGALEPVVDRAATPDILAAGDLFLQPGDERRRSGSHYTPRPLTAPIVTRTLEPLLARLHREADGPPRPEQILDLKICDPAMGSGAFLVETCRQLGDALIESWKIHGRGERERERERDLLGMKTRWWWRDGWSRVHASTEWTGTRWRWIWPSSRSGSPPLPGISRSPFLTTRFRAEIPSWVFRGSKSASSTGTPDNGGCSRGR